jgi:CO/xanthine dehydrogenase Mo-binding subunit
MPEAVGTSRPRLEGRRKVAGRTGYTADMRIPGLCHLRLVLSPHAAARITAYDLAAAREVSGVVDVVAGPDLTTTAGLEGPHELLAKDRVYYAGQPVVAVVGETPAAAADGAALVQVDYEPLPAVSELLEALTPDAPTVFEKAVAADEVSDHATAVAATRSADDHPNVLAHVALKQGDVDAAFATAAHVVRGRWVTPRVHQAPIETHVVSAVPSPERGVTVFTPTQGPYRGRTELAHAIGLPLGAVRLVPMPVGGGFGGKAITLVEPLVALLALRLDRPVICELTRTEEFLYGRPAAAAVADVEIAASASGDLIALRARVWYDTGAGGSRGMAGSAAILLGAAYRFPAYDYEGFDVQTNRTPIAPYRAPSAPPVNFAIESAMDELARLLGHDPAQFKIRHLPREGDPRTDGKPWPPVTMVECLEHARQHPLYTTPCGPGEGVGVAVGVWLGVREPASAACRVEPDGSLALQVGYVDLTGTDTTMAMLAADAFGVDVDQVRVELGDTGLAPFGGSSGGSKTTYSNGPAVIAAAREARRQLLEIAADRLEAAPEDLAMTGGRVHVAGMPSRGLRIGEVAALGTTYNGRHAPILGVGRYGIDREAPMCTAHVCRVRADAETGEWRVIGYLAVQDVGRALNPAEIEGQIHGGVMQSLGRALGEVMVHDSDGTPRTASFLDYDLPSIDQAPHIEVELLEIPSALGPLGAKGVGEPPAIPAPAAVGNALRAATGLRFNELPFAWQLGAAIPVRAAR